MALDRLDAFSRAAGVTLDVIVADDGSSDGTPDLARQWAADHNGPTMAVRMVEIAHQGKGAAVRAGLRGARAPIVGYCDVDLSAGPEAIEILYRKVKDGTDVAIASRTLAESVLEVHQPWLREFGGRCFNALLRRMTGIPFHDTQCGLKLFRAEVAKEVFRYQRLDGFAFDAELVVLAVRLGFEVKEVAVRWSHDSDSRVSMLRDSVAMSRDMVRIVRRLRQGKVHSLGVPDPTAMDRMTTGEVDHWWYVAKRRLIAQYWPDLPPAARCLDVGCGGGAALREVGRFVPAFGVDLSPRALQHGQSGGLSRLARADATALPFASGSFSVALALDVLEHYPHPETLLDEIGRVLTEQGLLPSRPSNGCGATPTTCSVTTGATRVAASRPSCRTPDSISSASATSTRGFSPWPGCSADFAQSPAVPSPPTISPCRPGSIGCFSVSAGPSSVSCPDLTCRSGSRCWGSHAQCRNRDRK